jgi:hypothetical protein
MNSGTITINGVDYPCRLGMGALLYYKEATGKEISEFTGQPTESVTFLWCCVKCACKREKMDFDYTLEDFACWLDLDEVQAWATEFMQSQETSSDTKKKTARKK